MHGKFSNAIGLGLLLSAITSSASSGLTSCEVDVYTAYQKATENRWQFICDGATFIPNKNQRSISCVKSAPASSKSLPINARFFVHPYKASSGRVLSNGWKISTFRITGARWQQNPTDALARISAVSHTRSDRSDFKLHLGSLTLEKTNGDCTKVYIEAFE